MINNPNYPLRSLTLFIFPLLVAMHLMRSVSPPADKVPHPYNSVVLALEFATSNDDVLAILTPLKPSEVTDLDHLNYYDFFFMLVYSAFLGQFIAKYLTAIHQPRPMRLAFVAAFICLADLAENFMLLKITSLHANDINSFMPYLTYLMLFTWLKWGALAVTFAGLGIMMIQRETFSKITSVVLFLPALLLALCLADYSRWINMFTTSIFLGFVILLIFATFYKKPEHITDQPSVGN